eukprot:jgi/Chlat1/4797/Chrsp31S04782
MAWTCTSLLSSLPLLLLHLLARVVAVRSISDAATLSTSAVEVAFLRTTVLYDANDNPLQSNQASGVVLYQPPSSTAGPSFAVSYSGLASSPANNDVYLPSQGGTLTEYFDNGTYCFAPLLFSSSLAVVVIGTPAVAFVTRPTELGSATAVKPNSTSSCLSVPNAVAQLDWQGAVNCGQINGTAVVLSQVSDIVQCLDANNSVLAVTAITVADSTRGILQYDSYSLQTIQELQESIAWPQECRSYYILGPQPEFVCAINISALSAELQAPPLGPTALPPPPVAADLEPLNMTLVEPNSPVQLNYSASFSGFDVETGNPIKTATWQGLLLCDTSTANGPTYTDITSLSTANDINVALQLPGIKELKALDSRAYAAFQYANASCQVPAVMPSILVAIQNAAASVSLLVYPTNINTSSTTVFPLSSSCAAYAPSAVTEVRWLAAALCRNEALAAVITQCIDSSGNVVAANFTDLVSTPDNRSVPLFTVVYTPFSLQPLQVFQ